MRNKFRDLVLLTLFILISSNSWSDDDPGYINRVVAVEDQSIYSLETDAQSARLFQIVGKSQKLLFSWQVGTRPHSPQIMVQGGKVYVAWLQKVETAYKLSFNEYFQGKVQDVTAPEHSCQLQNIHLANMAGRAGLLLASEKQAAWFEADVDEWNWRRVKEFAVNGKPYSVSSLCADVKLLTWQEKQGREFDLALTDLSESADAVVRRRVQGFAGNARPALLGIKETAVIWQGSKDDRAVLKGVPVEGFAKGEAEILPLPAKATGVLAPERVKGVGNRISSYGLVDGKWSGITYTFEDSISRVEAKVHTAEASRIIDPDVVVIDGEEKWIWQDEEDADVRINSKNEFEYVLNIRPDQEQFSCLADDQIRILAWGDSITAGKTGDSGETTGYLPFLCALLEEKLFEAEIWQCGRSSETTYHGLIQLQATLDLCQYDYVLILEGTNDQFTMKDDDPRLSPEDTAWNLVKMAEITRKDGAIPVIGTLLPKKKTWDGYFRIDGQLRSIHSKPALRLAGVTLCDFQSHFPFEHDFKKPNVPDVFSSKYYSDGPEPMGQRYTHPSETGYEIMGRLWFESLLTFQGDVNRDQQVDEADLLLFNASLDTKRGEIAFNPDCDFNDDGKINVKDMTFLIAQMGKSWKDEE